MTEDPGPSRRARADVYVSADVEADGPIPGPYSMLSFGLSVAARFDGHTFVRADPEGQTFYCELAPISEAFVPEALAVSGLDRERLAREGRSPQDAMESAAKWIVAISGDNRPVLVAYPLAYDWLWLYWYFERFAAAGSPFGHSSCLDIKTLYQQKAQSVMAHSTKRFMPRAVRPRRRHTHHALDDAIEQAELFANLWEWRPLDDD
jgi:hypothetical protein